MVQLGKMQVETALFFETSEEIYARVYSTLRPFVPVPEIVIRYRKYANANSRISLKDGQLSVDISDVLEGAPAPIREALASILISKLLGTRPDRNAVARYRHYLNRADFRRVLHLVKQERGRKRFKPPQGTHYDLVSIFDHLNREYFGGLMAQPHLGWSLRSSRSTLGHYDPSHNAIVLSSVLDSAGAPEAAVEFVMFHEMLHLRHPTEHRGGRRCVHTAEFKRAEKSFRCHKEVKLMLRRFVERLGDPSGPVGQPAL